MKIRLANHADVDDLIRLNDQIQRQHAEQYPEEFRYPIDKEDVRLFFEDIVASESKTVVVACDETRPFAYLYYELRRTPESTFKFAKTRLYIQTVLVDEDLRRTGAATALFDWVEKDAREGGITSLALDTWMLNTGAHRFFESRGFQVTQILFSKVL